MKLQKVNEFPHDIMLEDSDYYVSIYMPTHKEPGNWKQDRVRLKNLITETKNSLLEKMNNREVDKILKPLTDILENLYFWNSLSSGLGILLNENQAIYYVLNRDVEEYAEVSKQFYIKPLIRNYQSYDKYHVLALSKDEFKLYEGSRYSFEQVNLGEEVITKKEDLLADEEKGRVINFGSYKGARGDGAGVSIHGHNTKQEAVERDTRKFFRYIDHTINKNYSLGTDTPLILITLPENQGEFRKISKNKNLLERGINRSPDSVNVEELNKIVWEVIEPIYLKKTEDLLEQYENSKSEFIASRDPLEIAYGCEMGRVDTLIVEADRVIPKVYDKESRKLMEGDLKSPEVGDLINQLAIMTISQGGEVIVLPKERFPEESGVAAIFRY